LGAVPIPELVIVHIKYQKALGRWQRVNGDALSLRHARDQDATVNSREFEYAVGVRGGGADAHIVLSGCGKAAQHH
jgi:hypothetical protein